MRSEASFSVEQLTNSLFLSPCVLPNVFAWLYIRNNKNINFLILEAFMYQFLFFKMYWVDSHRM